MLRKLAKGQRGLQGPSCAGQPEATKEDSPIKTGLHPMAIAAYFRCEHFTLKMLVNETVKELKERVKTRAYSVDVGQNKSTELSGADLVVYTSSEYVGDAELLRDDSDLAEDRVYFVYEQFDTVPVDLYRTVSVNQLYPAVRAESPSAFTDLSPVYLACIRTNGTNSDLSKF
jgi:hypothetical protein